MGKTETVETLRAALEATLEQMTQANKLFKNYRGMASRDKRRARRALS